MGQLQQQLFTTNHPAVRENSSSRHPSTLLARLPFVGTLNETTQLAGDRTPTYVEFSYISNSNLLKQVSLYNCKLSNCLP